MVAKVCQKSDRKSLSIMNKSNPPTPSGLTVRSTPSEISFQMSRARGERCPGEPKRARSARGGSSIDIYIYIYIYTYIYTYRWRILIWSCTKDLLFGRNACNFHFRRHLRAKRARSARARSQRARARFARSTRTPSFRRKKRNRNNKKQPKQNKRDTPRCRPPAAPATAAAAAAAG